MKFIFGPYKCNEGFDRTQAASDISFSKIRGIAAPFELLSFAFAWGPVKVLRSIIRKMQQYFVQISKQSCVKVSDHGKRYANAYLFVKKLASLYTHPVLLDFDANYALYASMLSISRPRFIKLIKEALRLNLASYEGKNLRLRSRTQDKAEFKTRNRETVAHQELNAFYCYAIINNNIKRQVKTASRKFSTVKFESGQCGDLQETAPYQYSKVNTNITLSIRAAAKLLGVSTSYAHNLLRRYQAHGLTIQQNIVQISKETFKQCLALNKPNVRYNKDTKQYFYVKAQFASWNYFKSLTVASSSTNIQSSKYYDSQYW